MKKKIETPKKYLCVVCGCIFLDTSPKTFACTKCKTVLLELSNEVFENIKK